jgi:uncharacterized membrane protein
MLTSSTKRVLFVDFARAIAVLFMVQGHGLAVLLAPGFEQTAPFAIWLYLRGLTSCTFLILSGFSFALATERHRAAYLAPSRRLWRRMARLAVFLALGYAMRIPVRPLSQFHRVTASQWQAFSAVDILQLVAVTLFVLQVLTWLCRTSRRFGVAALSASAFVVLTTPLVWNAAPAVPLFVRSYLTMETGSLFPLFPWGAYVFLGAALGVLYVNHPLAATRGGRGFALIGATMMTTGVVCRLLPIAPYGPTEFWTVSPNLFLVKAGAVLILLAGAVVFTDYLGKLPRMFSVLSRESLTVYFVHLCIVYGSIWNDGLYQLVGPRLGLSATLASIAALLVGISALAWAWFEFKQRWHHSSLLVRSCLVIAAVYVIA